MGIFWVSCNLIHLYGFAINGWWLSVEFILCNAAYHIVNYHVHGRQFQFSYTNFYASNCSISSHSGASLPRVLTSWVHKTSIIKYEFLIQVAQTRIQVWIERVWVQVNFNLGGYMTSWRRLYQTLLDGTWVLGEFVTLPNRLAELAELLRPLNFWSRSIFVLPFQVYISLQLFYMDGWLFCRW